MALELSDVLPSIFMAGDKNDPRVNAQLRQRMALTMMAQKKAFPKNLGEGLTAIGDAIGDRSQMRQLMEADLAQQGVQPPAAAAVSPVASYAPESSGDLPPPVAAANAAVEPAVAPPAVATAPVVAATSPDVAQPPPTDQPPAAALPPAETYTPPTPEQVNSSRNALTRGLLARQTAAGGPPQNPMLAGAAISGAAPLPSTPETGSQPDQRLALNAPQDARGAVTDIRPAPPVPSQIRQAPPPQQVAQAQQLYPSGYIPPEPGAPPSAPIIPMKPRELQLRQWLAANQGNPYAAMKVGPELSQLELARTTRQNEANEYYKAQLARGTTQAGKRIDAEIGQADTIQKWKKGQQELIAGGATPDSAPPAGSDPRLGTPASPQRTGVPAAPPVPPGSTPDKWALEQAPRMAKAIDAVEKSTPKFSEMLATLKLAREHPGREWGVGAASEIARRTPGTSAYGFGKIMEQIGGQNFLNAYQQLKGGGSITEIEGTKAEAAQARLAAAQNKADFDRAMIDFEKAVRQDMETAQRKVNQPVTAWRGGGDNASFAPDVGQRRGDKEYIGGNPADPMSWRRVQ